MCWDLLWAFYDFCPKTGCSNMFISLSKHLCYLYTEILLLKTEIKSSMHNIYMGLPTLLFFRPWHSRLKGHLSKSAIFLAILLLLTLSSPHVSVGVWDVNGSNICPFVEVLVCFARPGFAPYKVHPPKGEKVKFWVGDGEASGPCKSEGVTTHHWRPRRSRPCGGRIVLLSCCKAKLLLLVGMLLELKSTEFSIESYITKKKKVVCLKIFFSYLSHACALT